MTAKHRHEDELDDSAFWKEHSAAKRERRNDHARRVIAKISDQDIRDLSIKETAKNVFRADTPHGAVMFYPTSSIIQHKGRTSQGGPAAFVEKIKALRGNPVVYVARGSDNAPMAS